MHKKKIQKNGLVLFIIGIFIGMAAIPLAGGTTTTQNQLQTLTMDPECEPYYFGELGKNGWYISCVLIRFHCDLELVEAIKYSFTPAGLAINFLNHPVMSVLIRSFEPGNHKGSPYNL